MIRRHRRHTDCDDVMINALALPDGNRHWTSPAVSLALHVVVIAALAFVSLPNPPSVQPQQVVSVTFVKPLRRQPATLPQADPSFAPAEPDFEAAPREANHPPASPAPAATDPGFSPVIRPQRMLSEAALASPRSSQARRQLRLMAADERLIQLCNVEAMEQVHAWNNKLKPSSVLPYAFEELQKQGRTVLANGAAFRDAIGWHRMRFECEVTADRVTSFAFSVGKDVPRSEWSANNLPEAISTAD